MTTDAYSQQALRNVRENKVGILLQALPQRVWIVGNQISGESNDVDYTALGVELLYERVIDDSFSYGIALGFWSPPSLNLKVYDSEVTQVVPSLIKEDRPQESYDITMSQTLLDLYMKTYLAPNRTRGIKPFVQAGLSMMQASIQLSETTFKKEYDLSTTVIVKYISGGMDYNFRNGVGLQAAMRFLSGFSTEEFVAVKEGRSLPVNKYLTLFTHNTLLAEIGILYGF